MHLDAIRGLAALVVVLGHTRGLYFTSTAEQSAFTAPPGETKATTGVPTSAPASRKNLSLGNEAVIIFFVLSGFLVGGSVLRSLRKNIWSWQDYLTKRLTRLWVVLIPALLLGYALDHAGIAMFGPHSIYGLPTGPVLDAGNLASRLGLPTLFGNLFFTQGILVEIFGVNESLWSLSYEFWYYLMFPLLMIALVGRAKLVGRVLAAAGLAVLVYFVSTRMRMLFPIWMLGAAVAWLPMRLPQRTARVLAAVFAVSLVVLMPALRVISMNVYASQWTMAIGSGSLIYVVKHLTERRRADWYSAISGFFSRISYTLYLVHLPLAVFLCAMLNRPWHIWAKTGRNLMIWFGADAIVIAVAYVLYRLFEANTDAVRKAITGQWKRQRSAA